MIKACDRNWVYPTLISAHFYCTICTEVLKNPKRLECGHVYCDVCVETYIIPTKMCPLDRGSIVLSKIHSDKLVH